MGGKVISTSDYTFAPFNHKTNKIQKKMKKNNSLAMSTRTSSVSWKNLFQIIIKPVEWLQYYYATVLQREINQKQTLLLINAQIAFIMTAFPVDAPLIGRFICCGWFLDAVLKCKRAL